MLLLSVIVNQMLVKKYILLQSSDWDWTNPHAQVPTQIP